VRGLVGDAEVEHHLVDERRIRQRGAARREIFTCGEHQPITAAAQRVAFEQRCVAAAVAIGHHVFHERVAVAEIAIERNPDARAGTAVGGIEHVRGQASHRSTLYTFADRIVCGSLLLQRAANDQPTRIRAGVPA
jgi:hypothetical protein